MSLPEYHLNASSRSARDLARHTIFQTDMNPPYQRGSVWTEDQRIGLVKSWVMGVPIPSIILNDRASREWTKNMHEDVYDQNKMIWAVVDGKQRLQTAELWFGGMLAVPAWWFPADHIAGDQLGYSYFSGLTLPGQRLFANKAQLSVVEARLPDLAAEAELYLLINGGGTSQTDDDMTRAASYTQRP